jgi:ABC-2 type transport system ATP-binding protein
MISIQHLNKRFGNVQAVNDLSLEIPAGELFCFLGPNGAGKTTTIKMMTGLLRPDSGTIRIGGFDVQKQPVEAKRIMGYIPDMPFLYEKLTPVEFLKFVAGLYNVTQPDLSGHIESSLRQFGLQEARNALIGELSHGMRQRLLYIATFIHAPQVIFIDEPLIGLDPHSIRMIKNLLRAKVRDGMTILLTTHILALAEDIADRIGIISGGRLIALGKLGDLRTQSGDKGSLEDIFLNLTASPEPLNPSTHSLLNPLIP